MKTTLTLILSLLITQGCSTFAYPKFYENLKTVEYSVPDENGDQYVVSESYSRLKMKNLVVAGIFSGTAVTDLRTAYISDDWSLEFGGTTDLLGGDLSIEQIEKLLEAGALEMLMGGF